MVGFGFIGMFVYGMCVDGGICVFEYWIYEFMFVDVFFFVWCYWFFGCVYLVLFFLCLFRNEFVSGEICSDWEIFVDGIWELWFLGGKVGCLSYFFEGSVVYKYLLEGINDEYVVCW